jgi:hypothetical protein
MVIPRRRSSVLDYQSAMDADAVFAAVAGQRRPLVPGTDWI